MSLLPTLWLQVVKTRDTFMFDKFLENCQTHFLDRPAEWLFQFVSLCATKSACKPGGWGHTDCQRTPKSPARWLRYIQTHICTSIYFGKTRNFHGPTSNVCCVLICCPSLLFVCCLFAALRTRNKVQKLQSGCCPHAKWARRRGERGGWLSKASR